MRTDESHLTARLRLQVGRLAGVVRQKLPGVRQLVRPGSILLFFLLWEVFSRSGTISINLFPPPSRVLREAAKMLQSGMMLGDITASGKRALASFALGSAIGVSVGLLTGRSSLVRALVEPLIQLFRPIPSIAFVPLSILWFGLGEESKLFLISYAVFFPVWLNTHVGVTNVDRHLIRAARCLGANERHLFYEVILPASLPHVLVGLRVGIAIAFLVLVAAEMSGANAGIGFRIEASHLVFRADRMLVGLLLLGVLGATTDFLFNKLVHRFAFWTRGS